MAGGDRVKFSTAKLLTSLSLKSLDARMHNQDAHFGLV